MGLLTQHWAQVLEYATLCTNSPQAADALARAAFRRQLAGLVGQAGPRCCHLLGAVVETTQEWDADERRFDLREGLRTGPDGQESQAIVMRRDRGLLLHGFQQLPEDQQVLLWHTEVEADDLAAAASHAGLDQDTARVKLHRARAQLRVGCRQAHADLAPDQDCCRYNRLIDVFASDRQVTELVPDLRQHLSECAYCRAAVGQLDQRPERLPLLLAEAVLGFGAADYLSACRARSGVTAAVSTPEAPSRAAASGAPTTRAWKRRARRAARRRVSLLFGGAAAVSGLLTGALLGVSQSSLGHDAGTGAAESTPPRVTSSAERPAPGREARLRHVATGLCLDIGNHDVTSGATAVTAPCTQVATQLWHLDPDGLLRSHADPGLCLDSADASAVEVRPCTEATGDRTGDFQYVLSHDGLLFSGRDRRLVLTPGRPRQAVGLPVVLRAPGGSFPRGFVRWHAERGT